MSDYEIADRYYDELFEFFEDWWRDDSDRDRDQDQDQETFASLDDCEQFLSMFEQYSRRPNDTRPRLKHSAVFWLFLNRAIRRRIEAE